MSTRTAEMQDDKVIVPRTRYNALHAGAIIGHAFSYLTTLWAVQWVWPSGDLVLQSLVAYLLEFLLFTMKGALWNTKAGDDGVGYAGVGIDTLINAGGILPRAAAVLSFPPVAVVLALFGALLGAQRLMFFGLPLTTLTAGGETFAVTLSGLLVAIGGGILLSAAPHRIWRAAERSKG